MVTWQKKKKNSYKHPSNHKHTKNKDHWKHIGNHLEALKTLLYFNSKFWIGKHHSEYI